MQGPWGPRAPGPEAAQLGPPVSSEATTFRVSSQLPLGGTGGRPSHLGWNRRRPFRWSLQGRGKPLWALDGSSGPFCLSEEKCTLDAARQGGSRSAKAPGAGSCPVEHTETARLGTYTPCRPGKVSEHLMAPEAGSEAGSGSVNQARSR